MLIFPKAAGVLQLKLKDLEAVCAVTKQFLKADTTHSHRFSSQG
jgi:hypothetical protein